MEPILTTQASPYDPQITPELLPRLAMVPGGRFLLTAGVQTIKLWDIGPVGTPHRVGSSVIAEHPLETELSVDVLDLVPCIVDERTLRVAVASESFGFGTV
jgi:hypothetical protein